MMPGHRRHTGAQAAIDVAGSLWIYAIWAVTIWFVVNLLALIGSVVVSSFSTRWLRSWFPEGFTLRWYSSAWSEFQLGEVLTTTFTVVGAVVVLAGLLGVPAAYALARRNFPGKRWVVLLFLLPLMVPPVTYGIPLATVLYQAGPGGTIWGVILANLVPTVPFVILVMIPFIEQVDPRIEAAARIFGASTPQLFVHVLLPMLAPGILAALLLVLVRTIAMFELTFLTAGPTSQTLVVALYYSVFASGVRAVQSIDAMAVIYMVITLVWLLIALRFVNPTQLVSRVKRSDNNA
ncbi:MAG: ABC transporter permease [Rhodoferax sp.]|nr:ABC transporter permease [Rhodoferax sp.]MBP9928218.1 ABC transporter permease [Rhodoferax sp.]